MEPSTETIIEKTTYLEIYKPLEWAITMNTVNHRILAQCLQELGITDGALDWLKSFLRERLFLVKMGEVSSSLRSLHCGVPQGPSLSPTLFNVYMAPLAQVVDQFGVELVTYADDTQLVVTLKHPNTNPSSLAPCLEAVMSWMHSSHLKLNEDKSELMLLGNSTPSDMLSLWPSCMGPMPPPTQRISHPRNPS